ncbi:disulfide bond formation protein DsbB [Shewanella sp. SNU WT4]|uniref:disulfide bond formation protein DsbB n=1 Tax=Shewanella sp. SNU WT4 TaxID=2590015 RepID=UPI001F0D4151|nr:disulfide bond formation protein DsbB [Shewanella sp. SNU WT4]
MITENQLTQFSHSRRSWAILGLTALALEITALFFQYGLGLTPCVMCVYIRLAVFGIGVAALINIIYPVRTVRIVGGLLWLVSAGWGLQIATELVAIQSDPSPFATCDFLPNFPSFMPLHDWFPAVLMPTGMCTDSVWSMLGLSMAQWMQVCFSLYLIAWVIMAKPLYRANITSHHSD